MAETAILQRRNTKAQIENNPPIEGEIVLTTDTKEFGWSDGQGGIVWKDVGLLQPTITLTEAPTGSENDEIGTMYLVANPIVSIEINPTNGSIETNGIPPYSTIQYTATATYNDGTTADIDVQWASSDVLVAVSSSGLAEFVGTSTYIATVTITGTYGNNSGTAPLSLIGGK